MDIFEYRFDTKAFDAWMKSEEGQKQIQESLKYNALYQALKSQTEPICPVAGNE